MFFLSFTKFLPHEPHKIVSHRDITMQKQFYAQKFAKQSFNVFITDLIIKKYGLFGCKCCYINLILAVFPKDITGFLRNLSLTLP